MVPIKKLHDTVGTLDTLRPNCANCVKCAMQIFLHVTGESDSPLIKIVSGSYIFLVIR